MFDHSRQSGEPLEVARLKDQNAFLQVKIKNLQSCLKARKDIAAFSGMRRHLNSKPLSLKLDMPARHDILCRSIAGNIPDGVVAVFNHHLRLIIFEGTALSAMGLRREQFEGKLMSELDEDLRNFLPQQCRKGLSTKSIRYKTELGGRHFKSNYMPIYNRSGQVQIGIVVSTDDTPLVKAEKALGKTRRGLEMRVRKRTAQLSQRNQKLLHLSREVKQLARKTIEIMENDRKTMAIELHDRIGGTLAAIIYQLEGRASEMNQAPPSDEMSFERMIVHLHEMIYETRRIAKRLRPCILDDFGLPFALDEAIKDFKEFFPQTKVVRKIDFAEENISDEVKIVLYRVVQEALNNVGQHSHAGIVSIRMYKQDKMIYLEIMDNGCGFELTGIPTICNPLNGYGLHSMRERVELCKGRFSIKSSPGAGTRIFVSISI